jgi:SlyX protein
MTARRTGPSEAAKARDARLVELEVKFTHQQALLDELSGVLFAQQTFIDKLEARVKDLERRLADLGEPIPTEKPPHY